jgi:hypothetical protein
LVPQAVLDELRAGELAHPPLADVRNADWLEIVACDGLAELRAFAHYVRVLGAGERDIGEASVLAWAEVNEVVSQEWCNGSGRRFLGEAMRRL